MVMKILGATIGATFFTYTFNAPIKELPYCAIISALGYTVTLLGKNFLGSAIYAIFLASLCITYLSRVFSFRRKTPSTIYLISAILPLVPGTSIYFSVYYLISESFSEASAHAFEALGIAGALVLGILFILALPNSFILFKGKK